MSDPNDPTEPMDPIGGPEDDTPDIDRHDGEFEGGDPSAVPIDPADDPTLLYGAPPVVAGSIPDTPPEPVEATVVDTYTEEYVEEDPEGWWAQRTTGERAGIAAGIALLGILIAVLFAFGGDDEPTTTTLPVVIGGTTTTAPGDETTTTAAPGATTTTAAGETTTTTAPGETTTTTAPGETTTTAPGGTTTTSTPGETTTTAALPTFPSINGTGSATVPFATPDDLSAAVTITHDGTSTFVVIANDGNGNEISTLVERPGNYSGTVAINFDPANSPVKELEIIADGDWTAEATYSGDLDVRSIGGLSGNSDQVVRLDLVDAEQTAYTHDGTREFIVTAYASSGSPTVLVDIDDDDTGNITVPAGTAFLSIVADGNWTFTSGT